MIYVIAIVLFLYLLRRISVLESKLDGILKGNVPPQEAPQAAVVAQTISPATTPSPVISTPIPEPSLVRQHTPEPEPTTAQGQTAEFAVGSKVLTAVGTLAVLLGIGFFLRYAFENNLISPAARVALGAIFGIAVAVTGQLLRKKVPTYGSALMGCGLGILYLSIYAAYGFYGLMGLYPAIILLLLVTAGGVERAIAYNSEPLVAYSFLGAFIMPFILPLSLSVHVLFIYLVIINIGLLLVARFKVWPHLTIGSLVATSLIYLKWVFGPYNDILFAETFLYSTILFMIYFTTSMLNFVYRDRDYRGIDGFLLYIVPIVYFFINLSIVTGRNNVALFALMIALFYIILSLVLRAGFAHLGDLRKFSNAMLFLAAPFLAGAIALHFEGNTTTILWAVEAVAMVGIGYLLDTKTNRVGGILLSILTGIRMVMDSSLLSKNATAIFNERSATMLFVALMYVGIWWFYLVYISKDEAVEGDEKKAGRVIGSIGFFLVPFLWINLEGHDHLVEYVLYIPVMWLVFGMIMTSISFMTKEKILRFFSYAAGGVSLLIYLVYQWQLNLAIHPSFANIRVGTAIVYVIACSYLLWLIKVHRADVSADESALKNYLLVIANGVVLWAISLEILDFYNTQIGEENTKRIVLSIFWLGYALIGLVIGIFKRSAFARYLSIILFAVSIFKIFLYDTANLSDVYRFVSFISLGVILLIAGYSYYRFKDRITQFVHVEDSRNV